MPAPTVLSLGGIQTSINASGNIAWGAGHQADDIGLLVAESANETIALTTSAGFVEVSGSPQGTGVAGSVTATKLAVFWCRATSNAQGVAIIGDPGDHITARIFVFRGVVASGNPWDFDPVLSGDVEAAGSTSVSILGGTTVTNNCLVVTIASNAIDIGTEQYSNWANADLSGFAANTAVHQSGSGNGGGWGIAFGTKAVAGTYGATTATLASSSLQGRISIALTPADPSNAATGFVRSAGGLLVRSFAPRIRPLVLEPGHARSTDPASDTVEG